MPDPTSLINIGEISKPATVLIEKISDAVGGIFQPYQIKRVAQAEAEADIIRAKGQVEVSDLQRRAMQRFLIEEGKKQENIESITSKAIPLLKDRSKPQEMDDDWISNFFDKCRIISDQEMQQLWAKVLAGEANEAGTYSKRTVNFLGSLDKDDALLFTTLCGFAWYFGIVTPLVYDESHSIYASAGVNFAMLTHLADIGLITFNSPAGFKQMGYEKRIMVSYYGEPAILAFAKDVNNEIETGRVLLTKTGRQIAPICGSKPVPRFVDYVFDRWNKKDIVLSSPYPRKYPPYSGVCP